MNKQIILAKRVAGLPGPDTWTLEETTIPSIVDGQVLIKNKFISLANHNSLMCSLTSTNKLS